MKTFLTLIICILTSTYMFSQKPKKTESVLINGKSIYYEVYGKGEPLLLLHGYSQTSNSWKPYVKDYEGEYELYLIDLTGHGKSETFKENLSIKSIAEDLNLLIKHLKLDNIKAIGFSFGGDVLFQLALLNPILIESMITIGAVGTWNVDDFPQHLQTFTFENRTNFPWLIDHDSETKVKAIMGQFKNYKVKVSNEELQSIKPEVLIMIGDDDQGMDFNEIARVKNYLPKSDIWILPNVDHGAHERKTKKEFILKSKAFLSKN